MTQEPTGSRKHGVAATEIVVDALNTGEIGQAISVMSRGMRDNPLHVAAFGIDPDARLKKLQRLFTIVMTTDKFKQYALVARDADGDIVGVCGMSPPGDCTPTTGEQLRVLPRMLPLGPRPLVRVMRWMGAWAKHDPKERHWHLGPVAVDAHLQGQGIGSSMMQAFAAKMDALGEVAYLETDRDINVTFYRRFGFDVVAAQDILGVPNWFMIRNPRRDG